MAGVDSFGKYSRALVSELLEDTAGIIRAVNEEFRKLEESQELPVRDLMILSEQHVAPAKLYDGMLARAAGPPDWDPGSGQGFYVYVEGTGWVLIV